LYFQCAQGAVANAKSVAPTTNEYIVVSVSIWDAGVIE
jgi:hypothetical protein